VKYRHFDPLGRDVSVLVLGTACYERASPDTSLELLDAWRALGGNAIDTARRYGNAETIVGRWLRERDCRDDVVIVTKGGHPDLKNGRQRVTPSDIDADLDESLGHLGVDAIDLYLLHRDDPTRSMGEIVEHLESVRRSGRVRALGASNWTTQRLEDAAAVASSRELGGFDCSSPELSLAAPNEPPWPGCVTIHDSASLAWYARSQLPVLAWSSQAGGFFAGVTNSHVSSIYGSPANDERRRRAGRLGGETGFTATQVALAWGSTSRSRSTRSSAPRPSPSSTTASTPSSSSSPIIKHAGWNSTRRKDQRRSVDLPRSPR
jgi:aryl-alcohol dehydrogenase-like predicted oxidoreductase